MSSIEVVGLVRRYGRYTVLDGLDLIVEPGEKVAILGANGSGKTTLLRVAAGLLRPDEGRVRVGGRDPGDALTRRMVGFCGHVPSLYGQLTAAENVGFWSGLHATSADLGLHLLALLGLDPADPRHVATYSQGMRRRAALACAMAHDPDVLMLDEPFAGLDSQGTSAVITLLSGSDRSLLIATHEPDRAAPFCHRMLELDQGRLRRTR